jgi:hypothetical protein
VEGEKADGVGEKMQTTPPEEQMDTLVVFTAYHSLEKHRAVLMVSVLKRTGPLAACTNGV